MMFDKRRAVSHATNAMRANGTFSEWDVSIWAGHVGAMDPTLDLDYVQAEAEKVAEKLLDELIEQGQVRVRAGMDKGDEEALEWVG